jgi:hypothetical protein
VSIPYIGTYATLPCHAAHNTHRCAEYTTRFLALQSESTRPEIERRENENAAAICIYRSFLSHLYIKTIILPRQARDKHRENSKIYTSLATR